MVVLVLGGSGFLGRHLLRRLATEDLVVRAYGRRFVTSPGKVECAAAREEGLSRDGGFD